MKIMEKDAEDRSIKRMAKVKKATGMQVFMVLLLLLSWACEDF